MMPKFNEIIQPDRKQINWLNASFTNGDVFVDNSFQRRSVWVLRNKIRLIETILKNFPMPEIYLWAGSADAKTGFSKHSIVDGQQRLTAIREFIANEFALEAASLDDDSPASYRSKKFGELSDDLKQQVWEYYITIRMIPSSVKRDEIVEIFLRLNETDKSLNPQELRNAEFNGLFIKNVVKIADLPFWPKFKIFTAQSIRRMGDLQFISSLLMFLRSGIEAEVSQASINSMYDTYNDKYPKAAADFKATEAVLADIDKLFEASPAAGRFFKSQVHLYTLFIVIYQQQATEQAIPVKKWAAKLEKFAELYIGQKRPQTVEKYRAAATEGTQKRSNREERVTRLKEWLFSK